MRHGNDSTFAENFWEYFYEIPGYFQVFVCLFLITNLVQNVWKWVGFNESVKHIYIWFLWLENSMFPQKLTRDKRETAIISHSGDYDV